MPFEGLFVPDERIVSTVPVEEFRQSRAVGSRMNGCLPIGLALRCATLIDSLGKSAAAEAIVRQVEHYGYHVGQILLIAKHVRGENWNYLTVPPGGSAAFNQKMGMK